MAPEETFLDPPVTPAPTWAYRAVRGWMFGSPESPERSDNKENISPLKSRPKSVDSHGTHHIPNLSPQKRNRETANEIPISPTKSILRTPGMAPTPRMKDLKDGDAKVKFKSLSPSPQVRRKEALQKDGAKHTETKPTQETALSTEVKTNEPTTTRGLTNEVAVKEAPAKHHQPNVEIDLEAHNLRTAKEMRRLIRHGNKWREAAKRLDEDNTRLTVMLEEARRENRRLEAALRSGKTLTSTNNIVEERTKSRDISSGKPVVASHSRVKVAAFRTRDVSEGNRGKTQDLDDLLDLTPPPVLPQTSKALGPAASKAPAAPTGQRSISAPTPTSAVTSTSKSKLSHRHTLPRRPASISSHTKIHPHNNTNLSTNTHPPITTYSPLTALQHRIEGSFLPIADTAVRTGMDEDAVAHARRRLLARRERRRPASRGAGWGNDDGEEVEDGDGDVGRKGKTGRKLKGYGGEDWEGEGSKVESGFDWVGV